MVLSGVLAQNGRENVTYGNQVYPRNAMAALANNDPDYPGSCGRCYEIRCRSTEVIANGTTPYGLSGTYQLAAVAPNALDEHGRTCAPKPSFFPCYKSETRARLHSPISAQCA